MTHIRPIPLAEGCSEPTLWSGGARGAAIHELPPTDLKDAQPAYRAVVKDLG